ncbi:MAG: PD40 domain-containing protein [Chloroflexi bacterium]|nr:PD40 domain-containing protein [Chloroflexota bacterium]
METKLREMDSVPESGKVPPARRLTRFDWTVLAVIGLLCAALALTLALGDRVGVRVLAAGPLNSAHSTDDIFIQFSEDMNRASVEMRLLIEPALEGAFRWNGRMLIFAPARAMTPGTEYTVILPRGSKSDGQRQTLAEYRFSFRVGMPRVAYLSPADGLPNVWVASLDHPQAAQQVTFSPSGIYDFSVSPEGRRIAFSELDPLSQSAEIKVLNLDTGALVQVTNCTAEDSHCTNPVWRPDGNWLAYERIDFNNDLGSVGVSPTRIWLLDLSVNPPVTRPLFDDSQLLGYGPQWSGDGQRIAVFDNNTGGILIYSFADGGLITVPSRYGTTGTLSPDGLRLVFPEMILDGNQTRAYLRIADFGRSTFEALTAPDEPIDDTMPAWNSDGRRLAIGRRYLDERFTRGAQVYMLDTQNGEVTALVVDARYTNGFFSWDATGDRLVIQRFPELDEFGNPNPFGRPEVWVYDTQGGLLTQIAVNANRPRWIP